MNKESVSLRGKRVAILVTDGFEEVELTEPSHFLEKAGAETVLIAPEAGQVKSWQEKDWGKPFKVDLPLDRADAADFQALLLPGGVINADHLRMDDNAVRFVKEFFLAGKPVAVICHGAWIAIDAGVIKGRSLTSYPSLKADLANAGAKWVDQEVVVDEGLVSSRRPSDLPAFNKAMVEVFAQEHYMLQKPMEAFKAEQPPR